MTGIKSTRIKRTADEYIISGIAYVIVGVFALAWLYLMCIPGLVYLIIFRYVPMYGIIMAFQNFSFRKGIFGSPFNNFANFKELFGSAMFYRVLRNSVTLSFVRLIISFPIPIILALLINEINIKPYKKVTQTLMYLPHFLSWVVLGGIVTNLLSMSDGLVNEVIVSLGGTKINFLGTADTIHLQNTLNWKQFMI